MVGRTNVAGARLRSVIAVTYPEGSVCSCTNGTKTLKARDTSGKALFNVSAGEWTVSCTDGSDTASETVSITENGQSESVKLRFGFILVKNGLVYNNFGTAKLRSSETPTISKGDGFALFSSEGNMTGGVTIPNAIDVTDYSTLTIECSASGGGTIYSAISNKINNSTQDGVISSLKAKTQLSATQKVYTLDISSFSGNYYPCIAWVFGEGKATVKVFNMSLER